MRMLERRNRSRFALEPVAQLQIGGEIRRQNLDGNRAIEPGVTRAIDLAHSPSAERCEDFVGAKARSGLQTHDRAGRVL
jgi:hypothetical protein